MWTKNVRHHERILSIKKKSNSSLEIMHVLNQYYIENVTVCVNYTDFYTKVYTTV